MPPSPSAAGGGSGAVLESGSGPGSGSGSGPGSGRAAGASPPAFEPATSGRRSPSHDSRMIGPRPGGRPRAGAGPPRHGTRPARRARTAPPPWSAARRRRAPGSPNRLRRACRKRRARRVMVWGRPSMWSGSPTTNPSGFQVETIPSMESQFRLPAAHVHRRERTCGSGDGLPHRHPDAALAVVEPEEGPVRLHARPDCPDRRCISMPSPRAASSQRSSNGASKTRSRSAGPLSHAFCRTSFSSCPGPHPA